MDWKKSSHFRKIEFTCNCGCGQCDMNEQFIGALNMARKDAGIPFRISSGYRCESHNKQVGGVKDSSHTKGIAADILTSGSEERRKILVAVLRYFPRVGIHKAFIHVDLDIEKSGDVVWVY